MEKNNKIWQRLSIYNKIVGNKSELFFYYSSKSQLNYAAV